MQLHTSYSSLGREFKNIFEELVKHLNSQKAEAENLRAKLSMAAKAAMQADIQASNHLEVCLAEEREQAAIDRSTLLTQITDLVNKSGEKQEVRLEGKISSIRENIATSKADFESANKAYDDGMDTWAKKENNLVEEVLKSRDTLKGKMKKDWIVRLSAPYLSHNRYANILLRPSTSTIPPSRPPPSPSTKRRFA